MYICGHTTKITVFDIKNLTEAEIVIIRGCLSEIITDPKIQQLCNMQKDTLDFVGKLIETITDRLESTDREDIYSNF